MQQNKQTKQKLINQEQQERKKKFCRKLSHVYNPIAALSFVAIYWGIGLKNAQFY